MMVDSKKDQKREPSQLNNYYEDYQSNFKQWLHRLGYAESSVKSNTSKIGYFFYYLQTKQIKNIYQIEQTHYLEYYHCINKKSYSITYVRSLLLAIKNFSKYTQVTENYALDITSVTLEKELITPRHILSQKEIKNLFEIAEENTVEGLRDKVILHLLYSCGLRCDEAVKVRVKDLDYAKRLLYIQPGKTRKGRYVPMTEKVVKDLANYEQYARNIINPNGHYFLVNHLTKGFRTASIRRVLKSLISQTSIDKHITPHCLRHSIATHLLSQGMQLEYIQQFLGHQTLQTTQLYVRMTLEEGILKPCNHAKQD
jgi:integrase/recombinase XerD